MKLRDWVLATGTSDERREQKKHIPQYATILHLQTAKDKNDILVMLEFVTDRYLIIRSQFLEF